MLEFVKSLRAVRVVNGWSLSLSRAGLYWFGGFRPCGLRRTIIIRPGLMSFKRHAGRDGMAYRLGPVIVLWFA